MQGGLDFLFLLLVIMLWWNQRQGQAETKVSGDERVAAALTSLDERAQELERQAARYRQRLEEELAALHRICERAKSVLSQGQSSFPPSDEEYELKAALSAEKSDGIPKSEIPTLHQIERTRERLKSEIAVDLRHLLRDQLA
jgi:hypothetical protein